MTFRRTRVDETYLIPATVAGGALDYPFDTAIMQQNMRMLLKNIYFTFTADANAANRAIVFAIEDRSGNVVYATSHETPITATTVTLVNMKDILYKDWDAVSLFLGLPLPDLYLKKDYSITITVTNVQVGDVISALHVRYDRYVGVIE